MYEASLKRWALHDCSAIMDGRSDEEMRSLFRRWGATRDKGVTMSRIVTMRSLDRAWTAFVECWNKETGAVFEQRLEERGATHDRLSVAVLSARICRMSYDLDR
ncbi:hypothetical protein PI124_g18916 [Phytophthora idaei]|nr:hypothetical protein PI125_g21285 [Phytophthora idaei]KAG3135400.1 hypothetical protein PI126_g18272 [Phytophthora idaei]KAG3236065.1 hypothetical protein PI124_g18916 [Phytophthora idaei]